MNALKKLRPGFLAKSVSLVQRDGEMCVQKRLRSLDFFLNHVFVMTRLKACNHVPKLRSFSYDELTVEYFYVDGYHINEVDTESRAMCFFVAGQALAVLHNLRLNGYGRVFEWRDTLSDWWSIQDRRVRELLAWCYAERLYDREFLSRLSKYYAHFRLYVEPELESCLTHCDFHLDNLIFINEHGRWRCVVLDFDHVMAAAPHFDLGRIEQDIFFSWPQYTQEFLDGYSSIRYLPNLTSTLPLYRIIWPLNIYLWALRNRVPKLASEASERLYRVVNEERGR